MKTVVLLSMLAFSVPAVADEQDWYMFNTENRDFTTCVKSDMEPLLVARWFADMFRLEDVDIDNLVVDEHNRSLAVVVKGSASGRRLAAFMFRNRDKCEAYIRQHQDEITSKYN